MSNAPPVEVGAASNKLRAAQKAWRIALRDRDVTLGEFLREAPPCYAHWSLLEVMKLGVSWGRGRVSELNHWAVKGDLNLAVQWRDASPKAVAFCILAADNLGTGRGWAGRLGRG